MVNLFLFIQKKSSEYILENGLSIDKYANVSFGYRGIMQKGIISYLNPRDNHKLDSSTFDILVAKVNFKDCFVLNKDILNVANLDKNLDEYTIKRLDEYVLGDFISPRVAICANILPEELHLFSTERDIPILYDNSENLYYSKKIDSLKLLCESQNISYDKQVYDSLIEVLHKNNVLEEKKIQNNNIYLDNQNEDVYF